MWVAGIDNRDIKTVNRILRTVFPGNSIFFVSDKGYSVNARYGSMQYVGLVDKIQDENLKRKKAATLRLQPLRGLYPEPVQGIEIIGK